MLLPCSCWSSSCRHHGSAWPETCGQTLRDFPHLSQPSCFPPSASVFLPGAYDQTGWLVHKTLVIRNCHRTFFFFFPLTLHNKLTYGAIRLMLPQQIFKDSRIQICTSTLKKKERKKENHVQQIWYILFYFYSSEACHVPLMFLMLLVGGHHNKLSDPPAFTADDGPDVTAKAFWLK